METGANISSAAVFPLKKGTGVITAGNVTVNVAHGLGRVPVGYSVDPITNSLGVDIFIESVDITEKYDDCVEAPNFDPTTGKATRTAAEAADDFDLDELDGIGGDESAFDDLAEEVDDEPKAGSTPAAEAESSDEEDPDVDDLPEPEEDTEE